MLSSKKIIAVSHPIAKDISSWRMLREKIRIINNGITIEKYSDYANEFDPKKLRRDLGLQGNTKIVGTLGRLTFQKAHQHMIEAARIILKTSADIEFIVGGEGHRLDFLEGLTQKYGISDKFHFIGFRSDAINILKLLDIFVLCSVDEGLPIVLLEAMSVGKPIITTDVGEIPLVIQNNKNGMLVEAGNVNLFAEKILNLLFDPPLCEDLAVNAKKTVADKFSIEKMTEEYLKVYESIPLC